MRKLDSSKTYEQNLEILQAELAAHETAQAEVTAARQAIFQSNVKSLASYFKNNGVNFELKSVRRDKVWNDESALQFDFQFAEEGETWSSINIDAVLKDGNVSVKRFSFPSRSSSNDSVALVKEINYFKNITGLLELFNSNTSNLVPKMNNWQDYTATQEVRAKFEIQDDIDYCVEHIRINKMNFRVGQTLMADLNGPYSRYHWQDWQKVLITKINKRSVKFCRVLKDGTYAVEEHLPYEYRFFKSVEQHEAEEAAREEAIKKQRNKEI